MRRRTLLSLPMWAAVPTSRVFAAAPEPVTLTAADGVKVFGDFRAASQRDSPLILAFHQAESSRAEYLPLAPRLNRLGFHVLAIDQRSGGREFGGRNRTVEALGSSTTYEAALADLEAALTWGRTRAAGAPLLAWGSSYSAALCFLLAARHPSDLAGLLAFSPGEYLADTGAVSAAARKVVIPVFIDQSIDADELAQSRAILQSTASTRKTQFVPKRGGVHGSATLRQDRNVKGAEENWIAVEAFLAGFRTGR